MGSGPRTEALVIVPNSDVNEPNFEHLDIAAGEYIQELPKAIHQRPEWQIAAEMLLEAVEGKGPLMFAEIAMRKAVNAGKPAPEPTPRRKRRR
jgi:hypothetical protein